MKNLDIVLAVVGGAIAGAALGLLFAPKKGEEVRGDIMKKGEDVYEDVLEYLKDKKKALKRTKLEKLVDKLEADVKEA